MTPHKIKKLVAQSYDMQMEFSVPDSELHSVGIKRDGYVYLYTVKKVHKKKRDA